MNSQNKMVSFSSAGGALFVLGVIFLLRYFIYTGNNLHLIIGLASIIGRFLLNSAVRKGNIGGLIYLLVALVACYTFFYEGGIFYIRNSQIPE